MGLPRGLGDTRKLTSEGERLLVETMHAIGAAGFSIGILTRLAAEFSLFAVERVVRRGAESGLSFGA